MSRYRQMFLLNYHVFQYSEGLKKGIRHSSLDCVSSFDLKITRTVLDASCR